jgi:SAM-dependent methyltransferase
LLAYYNDHEKNFGCDAWAVSLEHSNSCHVGRIAAKLSLSSAVPEFLPFEPETFDLVYAFSIFTHLSEVSAKACMQAIRKSLKPGGLAIITVRPIETWDTTKQYTDEQVGHLRREHLAGRVAFIPPVGMEIDNEGNPSHYGDSSMPLETLEAVFPGWSIRKAGSTIVDPYQILVVLEKVEK